MATFADGSGRTWEVRIKHLEHIEEIQRVCKIWVCDIYDQEVQRALLIDFVKQAEIVWFLVHEQAKEVGVSKDEFKRELHGPVLEGMREALRAEIANFLPSQEQNTFNMYELMGMVDSLPSKISDMMMQGMSEPLMEGIQEQMEASMQSAGESQDNLASTPAA